MNEDMLRAMIRESVARHLGAQRPEPRLPPQGVERLLPFSAHALPFSAHASHFRYTLPESGGPCYVEPAVLCNHCGFCQSHGH